MMKPKWSDASFFFLPIQIHCSSASAVPPGFAGQQRHACLIQDFVGSRDAVENNVIFKPCGHSI